MVMSVGELCDHIREAEGDAVNLNSELRRDNKENMEYYLGEPFGNEMPEESQVVSTDVSDVVESDMPSLARVFLGNSSIMTFQPTRESEEEVQEAEEKTKYIDWLIRKQPHSFRTLHGWFKDSEVKKFGVVKYFVEDIETTREVKFKGLSQEEIQITQDDLNTSEVESIDIVSQEEAGDRETFDITFKVTNLKSKKATYEGVETENFIISRGAKDEDDAELVGDIMVVTRGELKEMKVPTPEINKIPISGTRIIDTNRIGRFPFNGVSDTATINQWASEKVEIRDLYVKIDFDEDGIAERRRVLKSSVGDVVIINEAFNHVPYAMISSLLMPHSAIGRSRTDLTKSNQLQKSTILRQSFNNLWLHNNPRTVVNDGNVHVDDMLVVRSGGIVRTDGIPQQDVMELGTTSTLQSSLSMIQYLDFARAQSTGTLMASQGLNADDLQDETATRFEGIEEEGEAKIELVARVIAETGMRKLYEGMAWMVTQFQDTETEFMVLGKPLKTNPSKWKFEHHTFSEVGIGAGDNERLLGTLTGIYQLQQQLKAQGSSLTDEADIFNTLDRMIKGSGLPRTDEFFNNPERPEELVNAENEILRNAVQELQGMVQQLQNPLVEPETIKQKVNLVKAQSAAQLDAAELTEKARQFDTETAQKQQQQINDQNNKITELALKLTEMEQEANQQLDAQLDQNQVSVQ
ncbi:MAG: hypothetical protein V3W52_17285 [Syntrophobacteria bacterium]